MNEASVQITPLGGLGEIGLNCQLWECADKVVMIDCGLMFPDDSHLGVDVLVPHFDAVKAVKDKLCGIILTHGHEDHIGALPWIVLELKGIRLYGSKFTLALVEHKLKEHELLHQVELCPVNSRDILELGQLKFHFFPVCHSIPHGFGLGVETPVGKMIHSGDFKIDPDALDGHNTELEDFSRFAGPQGARLLLSDSTNVLREGRSLTEKKVKASLEKVFASAKGRIVITLFSSHIQRIQEVFDLAREYGRSVIISGKSLANNIDIATSLGYAVLPPDFHNAFNGLPENVSPEKTVLIVTGAQGEPLSALSRMVWGGHKQLNIGSGDTVIMSSRVIPGNTRAIAKLINEMYRLGANVLYEGSHSVHASGHGYREELRDMLLATRPQLFVPIHGEYQHLIMHGRLAEECGIPPSDIIILEDGQPLIIFKESFRLGQRIPVDCTLVDGKGVGDVGTTVLKERRILGDEGVVIVSVALGHKTGDILHGPEIISRGFVFEQQLSHVLEDAKCLVLDEIELGAATGELKENIRTSLRRFFRRVLERDPIIVPVISEIDCGVMSDSTLPPDGKP